MTSPRSALGSIDTESLADVAYRSLRDAITSGELAGGSELNEVQLAARLGVSRTPLRDAVRRLQADGLVRQSPRRLARVREFAAEDFVDIYNARLAIEPAAVRLCVRRRADLRGARRILDSIGQTARDGDAAIGDLEHAFHLELVHAAGSPALSRSYASIGAQLRTALAANPPVTRQVATAVESHAALLRVVEAGDERAAFDAIQAHILDAVDTALAGLGADGEAPLSATADLYASP